MLCGVSESNGSFSCQHCRFRNTIIGIPKLVLTNKAIFKKENVFYNDFQLRIVQCVSLHSTEIINHCRNQLQINKISLEQSVQPKISSNIKVSNNLHKLEFKLVDLTSQDFMQPHLHNRFYNQNMHERQVGENSFTKNEHKNNGEVIPISSATGELYVRFQDIDLKIFNDLLNSVLISQLTEYSLNLKLERQLKSHLDILVTRTLANFNQLISLLRMVASENDGKILCAPYGKV